MAFNNTYNANVTANSPNGLQATYRGSAVTKQVADVFIPEMWSNEVKRFIDQSFILKGYVKQIPFTGKKGDRIHIPLVSRAGVYTKLPETPVRLQARSEGGYYFDIDQYKESSFMIEDIVGIQASYNLRQEYTREAGYALARDMENSLLALRAAINNVATQRIYNTADGTLAGASKPLDFAAILTAKLIMDKARVPRDGRVLLVSTTQYNQLLAVEKFINMDYRNGAPVQTGVVGTIFNIPVIMTDTIDANSLTGYVNGTGEIGQPTPGVAGSPYLPTQDTFTALPTAFTGANVGAAAEVHTAMLVHKEFAIMGTQKMPSTEQSRETLYLADAVVMSQIYGSKLFRPDHAVLIHTNGVIPTVS